MFGNYVFRCVGYCLLDKPSSFIHVWTFHPKSSLWSGTRHSSRHIFAISRVLFYLWPHDSLDVCCFCLQSLSTTIHQPEKLRMFMPLIGWTRYPPGRSGWIRQLRWIYVSFFLKALPHKNCQFSCRCFLPYLGMILASLSIFMYSSC